MPEQQTTESETEEEEQQEQQQQQSGEDPELAKWKRIARENEKRAKANADAARKLAEIEDRDKSELQKANERAEAAEQAAAAAALSALRAQVALDKQLPAKLAARLQGSTAEELAADAEELLAELGKKAPPRFDGGAGKPAGDGAPDMNTLLRQAAGRA